MPYHTIRHFGEKKHVVNVCDQTGSVYHKDDIGYVSVYGEYNNQRLTGLHETASINDFSYGISDRGASIRIPVITVENGWKGWLEDRRPASNADPYKIAARIVKTVKGAKV